jgi:hypothetical protein
MWIDLIGAYLNVDPKNVSGLYLFTYSRPYVHFVTMDADGRQALFDELKRRGKIRHRAEIDQELEQQMRVEIDQAIHRDFTSGDHDAAKALLQTYQSESAIGRLRVQLAALKLSGGKLEKLARYIDDAKRDYRDVLYWAEYPDDARLDTPEKIARFEAMCKRFGIKVTLPKP